MGPAVHPTVHRRRSALPTCDYYGSGSVVSAQLASRVWTITATAEWARLYAAPAGRPPGERAATEHRSRPKTRKIDADPELRQRVVDKLRTGGSPDQVAGRLRYEHPGQHAAWVSHEAIYTWIYALPKGALARLGILLRTGRTQRRPRGRTSRPGARIVGMTSIEARPAEVADRAVPGHWEGDLVIGKAGKTAMSTFR